MRHYSNSALLVDLYEFTMLQACFSRNMNDKAVFEFFVRDLSAGRNFLMTAGLQQVADRSLPACRLPCVRSVRHLRTRRRSRANCMSRGMQSMDVYALAEAERAHWEIEAGQVKTWIKRRLSGAT